MRYKRKKLVADVSKCVLKFLLGPFTKLSVKFVRTNAQDYLMMLELVEGRADAFIFYISTLSDALSKTEFIEAVAHECVHICQYYTGDLQDLSDNIAWFRGTEFNYTGLDDIYYYFSPWEVEARGMEEALLYLYREEI